MANEQLKILRKSTNAWNHWRVANPTVVPDLSGQNLVEMSLIGANLSRSNLNKADLREARLFVANLNAINLQRANLNKADLRWADLSSANLFQADFRRANLFRANLSGAQIVHTSLDEVNLVEAEVGATAFTNVDLSVVKGIETVTHRAPSHISISTIYRSKGKISEVFLRGAGVPDNFITYMHSLTGTGFEFYSCFISYSAKDQEFANRLHVDLQAEGVRCWFAQEDLKIGDKLRSSFDEAIRLHDKLLVVLSENSVKSAWGEKEVETAFEKERQEGRTVLFPIRLDDAVMETKEAWAADIRRTRHIGDFRNWKDHDSYKKAFERLLRDLKSKAKVELASKKSINRPRAWRKVGC